MRGSGIRRIVISGLANDFIQYFVTPEEYDRQHYEGGSTLFGRATSVFIQERLIALLEAMVAGEPAPPPDQDERRNGISDDAEKFPAGAESGDGRSSSPTAVARMDRARLRLAGRAAAATTGRSTAPFVRIQRRVDGRWRTIDSDLGLQTLWTVDEDGNYEALWEPTFKQRLRRAPVRDHGRPATGSGRSRSRSRKATDLTARDGGRVGRVPAGGRERRPHLAAGAGAGQVRRRPLRQRRRLAPLDAAGPVGRAADPLRPGVMARAAARAPACLVAGGDDAAEAAAHVEDLVHLAPRTTSPSSRISSKIGGTGSGSSIS